MPDHSMEVTMWGVRGSTPTPAAENLGYGGNTACITVRHEGSPLVILDGGSGLRSVGYTLQAQRPDFIDVHLVLTHFHWDHIQGIPYFGPIFQQNCRITFYSTETPQRLETILQEQMRPPYFPVQMPAVQAECRYRQVEEGGIDLDGLTIRPFRLCHPDGAHGYRLESGSSAVVYASDHEHGDRIIDTGLRENAAGADLLIYDSQYTPEEHVPRKGWGHSTWMEATRVANEARVKRLMLFHHDPLHHDAAIAAIERAAQNNFAATEAARERWSGTF